MSYHTRLDGDSLFFSVAVFLLRGQKMLFPQVQFSITTALPARLVSKSYMHAQAQDAIAIIRRRVQNQGKGLDDTMMPAYKADTKKERSRRGRITSIRNLTDSGRMMRAMYVASVSEVAFGIVAEIGFSTGRARFLAGIHQARDAWFGLSRIDKVKLQRSMQESIATEAQKHVDNPK